MSTVLITGINGFLGSNIANALSNKNTIIGLEYSLENLYRLKDNTFKVYSSNDDNLDEIFSHNKIDFVVHTATVYRRSNEPISDLLNTNIVLPVKLYELACKYNSTLFINTDSFFNSENSKYSFLVDYTLSKKHALEWLKCINGRTKLVNLKLFHMYGPNDTPNKFVPQIIKQLVNNLETIDLTAGEQKRDFIYVSDVVSAFECIINSLHLLSDNYYEFQVGNGQATSIRDFVLLIKKITKSTSLLKFGALSYRENEIMESVADNLGLLNLGWLPKISLEAGLTRTINQMKN